MSQNKGLARATLTGTLWVYSSFILSKGMAFAANVILARLLLPEDFGLLALGLLVINYIDTVADFGVSAAVIYRQEDPHRTTNNAFIINLASGTALTALAFFGAPYVARFFGDPRITPVMQALSLAILISSLGSIHSAILRKNLNFKYNFIPGTARALTKGLVSIGLALAGFGVWALVWGHVASWVVSSATYWIVSRWRPSFEFNLSTAREMVGYGTQMVLVNLFGTIIMNLDYVFIGRRMDVAQLGYYTIAFRIPELVILNICSVVSQAIFPAYAKLQGDMRTLQRGYFKTLQYVALITIPAGVGMALTAPEFVSVFYTARWSPAVPVMQFLALYALVYSLAFNAGDIYKATGRPSILNKIAIFRLALTLPMLWFTSQQSILAVAVGTFAVNVIITPVQWYIAARILNAPLSHFFDAIRPAALASGVMAAAILALRLVVESLDPGLRLAILVAAGSAAYAAALWLLDRPTLDQMVDLGRSLFRRKKPVANEP